MKTAPLLLLVALSTAIWCASARAEVETGRTLEPVELVLRLNGEERGKAVLPKGTPVRILERREGQVYLQSRLGTEWAPASAVQVTMEPVAFEEATSPALRLGSGAPSPSMKARESIICGVSSFARAVFDLSNEERKARGLPALQWSDSLAKAAAYHAAHMASHRYFDHDTRLPGGKRMSPKERISRFDAAWCGENIAQGQSSPQQVMANWMSSPGHRRNILQPEAKRLGVGHVRGYWVQVFGREEQTTP